LTSEPSEGAAGSRIAAVPVDPGAGAADVDRDAVTVVTSGERTSAGGGPSGIASAWSSDGPIVFGPFTAEKPELLVAAAFAGAFVLAQILKKITS
jgi:hypothetical protein